jgi:hypothetical protein
MIVMIKTVNAREESCFLEKFTILSIGYSYGKKWDFSCFVPGLFLSLCPIKGKEKAIEEIRFLFRGRSGQIFR